MARPRFPFFLLLLAACTSDYPAGLSEPEEWILVDTVGRQQILDALPPDLTALLLGQGQRCVGIVDVALSIFESRCCMWDGQVMDPDDDTYTCYCENGSDESDCWLDPGEPGTHDDPDEWSAPDDPPPGGSVPPRPHPYVQEPATIALDCDDAPVARGSTMRCDILPDAMMTVDSVTWEATTGSKVITGTTMGSSPWTGTAVETSVIRATVHFNGSFTIFAGPVTVSVTNRNWSTPSSTVVDNGRDTAPYKVGGWSTPDSVSLTNGSAVLGYTCMMKGCSTVIFLDQDHQSSDAYSFQVVTSGPNAGLLYITSVEATATLGTRMNSAMSAGASQHGLPSQNVADCPSGVTTVNIHVFNSTCKGKNMSALREAIYSHEEHHILLGQQGVSGGMGGLNLLGLLENVTGKTPAEIQTGATLILGNWGQALGSAIASSGHSGWPTFHSGTIWFLNGTTYKYVPIFYPF